MTILFSPIGTADPMTILGDGPMLHLFRHLQPNRVVLFLSPKMLEQHKKDDRYRRGIRDCASLLQIPEPDIEIVESKCNDVYRFDYYIDEFETEINRLANEYPEEDIVVNVSSGTPGMLEALVAIGALGRQEMRLLQVLTPRKGVNDQGDRERQGDYDYDTLWELNSDNTPNAESRIVEAKHRTLAIDCCANKLLLWFSIMITQPRISLQMLLLALQMKRAR